MTPTRSRTCASRARRSTCYKGYLRGASLRSGGEGQISAFATEQAIDELAYAAKMDPIEFRRQNISRRQSGSTALERGRQGRELAARVAALEPVRTPTS